MAWLSGYSKRKPLTLTGGASGAQSNFQLELAIAYAAAMQGDFDDLRFTQADGTTLIDAWLESKVDDTSAAVWAEFPSTPANTVEQDYYMYYGNGAAASDWDIGATFLFGDDFPGSSIDTNKWDGDTGSVSVSGGIATLTGQAKRLHAKPNPSIPYVTETRYKLQDKTVVNQITGISAAASEYNTIGYYTHTGSVDILTWVNGSYTQKETGVEANLNNYEVRKFIVASTSDVKMYYDNTLELEITSNIPTVGMNHYYRSITGSNVLVDWAFVRKHASGPPTYAFGSEESAPTGVMPLLTHLYNQMRQ